ncbi:MAG: hypothetical protein L6N94_03170 [Candidatus Methylarchaceae archaeon HK01M]|nr:hypothetical protein [Candidatus Methylarchaceae archaeon HK01M]
MLENKRYTLSKGEVLLVKGPSAIRAEGEGLSALGIPIKPGEKVVVRKNKVLPFEVDRVESSVQIILGRDSEICINRDKVGMRIWDNVRETVFTNLDSGKKKLMIIGETDSGKSTLATYLTNIALLKDMKVCIIDGDIGQGDLAPPGCIGASMVKSPIYDLRDIRADFFEFVGFTSPRWVREIVIERIKKMISYIEEKNWNLCIVNTDGYVSDEGMDYKFDMVEMVDPEMIVCFKDIDRILFKGFKDSIDLPFLIPADRPKSVTKSPSERSERRLSQYLRFLKGGRVLSADLKEVRLSFMGDIYRHKLSNNELRDIAHNFSSKIFSAKRADDKLIVLKWGRGDSIEIFGRSVIFNLSSLKGMFVGLGAGEDIFGFAQITRFRSDLTITLNTPFNGNFDTLFLSTIRVIQNLRSETILPIVVRGRPFIDDLN